MWDKQSAKPNMNAAEHQFVKQLKAAKLFDVMLSSTRWSPTLSLNTQRDVLLHSAHDVLTHMLASPFIRTIQYRAFWPKNKAVTGYSCNPSEPIQSYSEAAVLFKMDQGEIIIYFWQFIHHKTLLSTADYSSISSVYCMKPTSVPVKHFSCLLLCSSRAHCVQQHLLNLRRALKFYICCGSGFGCRSCCGQALKSTVQRVCV